jgi:hypothetical protein
MSLIRKIRFVAKEMLTHFNVEEELTHLAEQAAQEQKGVSFTFTTSDTPAKTVTVVDGIITKVE